MDATEGDGGIVITRHPHLAERLRLLRNHGRITHDEHVAIGTNSRLDEVQAAALSVKLACLDAWNASRRRQARRYRDAIEATAMPVRVLTVPGDDASAVFHQFVIQLEDGATRDQLRRFLEQASIEVKVHYPYVIPLTPAFSSGSNASRFPIARRLASTILSLPMFPQLTDREIDLVVNEMARFFGTEQLTLPRRDELPPLLTQRGYTLVKQFKSGGSSAKTFLTTDASGQLVVVKYANWSGISGNGVPWIVNQYARLASVLREYPAPARELYPRVFELADVDGREAFLSMEYLAGCEDITEPFFRSPSTSPEAIGMRIDDLITLLVETHYRHHVEPDPDELRRNHLVRVLYRLELLSSQTGDVYERLVAGRPFRLGSAEYLDASYFFQMLMRQPTVTINGGRLPNLPCLIAVFDRSLDVLQRRLGPTRHSRFGHGDLALRNVFQMGDGSLRITDLRARGCHPTSPSDLDPRVVVRPTRMAQPTV